MNDELQDLLNQRDELTKRIIKMRSEQKKKNGCIEFGEAIFEKKFYQSDEGTEKYFYAVTMLCETRGQYARRQLVFGETKSVAVCKLKNFIDDLKGLYKELMLREYNYRVNESDFDDTPQVYTVDLTEEN